ncbi:glutamate--tRNA ligase family protein [Belliella marina]|uniref:Glutamate--tRNA ligase family protein n=1 Tax=Belliella marina TaxID=1644146 RepID=A0ABW4VLU4_9BACT
MEKFNLTRIAPTPSGFLHIGNVYSFLVTQSLAKKHNSKILLRIDDLDKQRVKSKYIQDIFDTLDFLDINYDIGPKNLNDFEKNFSVHKRLDLYKGKIDELIERKIVFSCDCSRNKIEKMHPRGFYTGYCLNRDLPLTMPGTNLRIQLPAKQEIKINTFEGEVIRKISGILRDFVIRKKDGLPAYQLQSVVDDIHYGVDLIVRGKDLWDSSLAQTYLATRFGENRFSDTTFHHHELIMGNKKEKLSKSAGATSIQYLRKKGMKKEDIFLLLGKMLGYKEAIRNLGDFSFAYFENAKKKLEVK